MQDCSANQHSGPSCHYKLCVILLLYYRSVNVNKESFKESDLLPENTHNHKKVEPRQNRLNSCTHWFVRPLGVTPVVLCGRMEIWPQDSIISRKSRAQWSKRKEQFHTAFPTNQSTALLLQRIQYSRQSLRSTTIVLLQYYRRKELYLNHRWLWGMMWRQENQS